MSYSDAHAAAAMERLRPELRRLTRENRENLAKSYIPIAQQKVKPLEGWKP